MIKMIYKQLNEDNVQAKKDRKEFMRIGNNTGTPDCCSITNCETIIWYTQFLTEYITKLLETFPENK